MSFRLTNEVWTSSLPTATHKLVLLAFADHANQECVCWPSMPRIAWMTGLSARQTRRIVQSLIASGALEVISEAGHRMSRRYRVRTDRLTPLPERKADTGDLSEGSDCPPREDTPDLTEGTPVSPEPSKEPSKEPTSGTRKDSSISTMRRRTDSQAWERSNGRSSKDDERVDWLRRRWENGQREAARPGTRR